MAEVTIHPAEEPSGAFKALKAERRIVKELEQKNRALRVDLTARVERLEARGLGAQLSASRCVAIC